MLWWTMQENGQNEEDIDSLSEWTKAVRSLILKRMKVVSRSKRVYATSVFKDPNVAKTLSTIRNICVVVPANKALNNIVSASIIVHNLPYKY